jgi:hypothetical protein
MSPTNKASIFYDIVTEYNDKGAKAAQKSFGSMDKGLAALGKKLAGVFSAAAVEEFARRSVLAFAKEDAALKVLGQTLGNIGLGFKTVEVSSFITKLAESTGVMKETLFPAFETLIRYTGDITKAQDLLKLSLNISAGTGKDTAAVALALGKAYGGNTTALSRLGAGLTKAELSSKNFALVQSRLNALFMGDAATAADSYQGKLNRLKVAFTEMQVQVGEGLTSALTTLGGNDGIQNLTDSMDRFGTSIKNASIGLSDLIGQISKIPGVSLLGKIGGSLFHNALFDYLQSRGKTVQADSISNDTYTQQKRTLVAANALTNIKKTQLAVDQKALQTAKDKAALEKANAALKLAGSVFDMSQIEIIAALQRNVSDDQKTRLELQLALLTSNADAAAKLTQELLATQIEALQVEKANPFFAWTSALQSALQALIDLQTQMAKFAPIVPLSPAAQSAITLGQDAANSIADLSGLNSSDLAGLGLGPNATYDDAAKALANAIAANGAGISSLNTQAGLSGAASTASPYSWFNNSSAYNPVNGNVNVTVMLDGNQVTSYINNSNQNATVGGTQLTTSRINQAAIG